KPVVLDRSASQLVLPGGPTAALEGGDQARPQPPRAASRAGGVATAGAPVPPPPPGGRAQRRADHGAPGAPAQLAPRPRAAGAPRRAAEGVPGAPVQLGSCRYGAWGSTGQVIRDCEGTDRDVDERLEGLDPRTRLAYRVNRQVIVLNDLSAGTLWMAADEYQKVDDWDVQIPEEAEGEESDAELTNPEQVDQFIADRSQPNRPPQPKDDSFGVRPGRT